MPVSVSHRGTEGCTMFLVFILSPPADKRYMVVLMTVISWVLLGLMLGSMIAIFATNSNLDDNHPVKIACYVGFVFAYWSFFCNFVLSIAVLKKNAIKILVTRIVFGYVLSQFTMFLVGFVGSVLLSAFYFREVGIWVYVSILAFALQFVLIRFFIAFIKTLMGNGGNGSPAAQNINSVATVVGNRPQPTAPRAEDVPPPYEAVVCSK